MATDRPRFSISLDDDTFDRVEQYQADGNFSTRSKAVEALIWRGLDRLTGAVQGVQPMPVTRSVPRLGTIACGEPILAEQNIEGYDEVPNYVKCDFTLTCRGDSMTGARVNNGDIVCVRQQPEVENGQIAAVLICDGAHEGATLKRVRYINGGIMLMPENSNYEPLLFTGEDVNKVHILGLATHFISTMK